MTMPNIQASSHQLRSEKLQAFERDDGDASIGRLLIGGSTRASIPSHRSLRGSDDVANSIGTSRLVEGSDISISSSLPGLVDGTSSIADSTESSLGAAEELRYRFRSLDVDSETGELSALAARIPVLQCPFEILGCRKEFPSSRQREWIAHSLGHFATMESPRRHVQPPSRNECCFCEVTFNHMNGTESWKHRMTHVAEHHRIGHSLATARPDFELLRYLWQKEVIDHDTFREIWGSTPDLSRSLVGNASPPVTEAEDDDSDGTETVTTVYESRRDRPRRPGN